MTKIHFLSDTLRRNSGFANVSKNLMSELIKRGYECSITGLNSSYIKTWDYGIESFPINTEAVSEDIKYVTNLMEVKPDIIFNLFGSDTGDMDNLLAIPLQCGIKKRLWYPPVDGHRVGINAINTLSRFTQSGGKIVAQCKWGMEQMKNEGIEVADCIYHGYNDKVFKKLNGKWDEYCYYSTDIGKIESNPEIIRKYNCYGCNGSLITCPNFKEESVGIMKYIDIDENNKRFVYSNYPISSIKDMVKGKFVFGFVGANFGLRKRIERLLKAYSILIKNNRQLTDRTILWLHTLPVSNQGINLMNVIKKLGIEKNIIFSYNGDRGTGFSEEALCRLYNMFDCNVSASSGEGFGLSSIESMSCGVPQIGTNICSFIELIGKSNERGLLVDCELQMIPDGCYRGLVYEKHLMECMKEMYENKNLRDKCSKNCIKFAQNYTWSKVVDKWVDIIEKL